MELRTRRTTIRDRGDARPRILVVDRDEILLTLLAASFEEPDVVVRATADACGTDDEIDAFAPDVVVFGLSIPSEQRFALLRRLTRAERGNPVGVTLIPGANGRSLDAIVAAGEDVYFRTPFDPSAIVASAAAA